jgi:hypothetical protein
MSITRWMAPITYLFVTSLVVGQTTPDLPPQSLPDHEVYAAFFDHVWQLTAINVLKPGANGEVVKVPLPSIQQAIGLTDRETALLNVISADYHSTVASIAETARPFVLDSRIQQIETGKVSEPLRRALQELEGRRIEMIFVHIRQLRESLGPGRFQVVDGYARGPESRNWTRLPSLLPVPPTPSTTSK